MRRFVVLALTLLFAAFPLATAHGEGPPTPENPAGRILGVVPTHGNANAASHLGSSGGVLTYHNGPVLHTNHTYAIYWLPAGFTVSPGYQSVINGFFQNVAAASGQTSNVYYSDTQYYDSATGKILNSSTFAGAYVDTRPFPANGCNDPATTVCLSDAQLQTELQSVLQLNGWSGGNGNIYFLLTPQGVGSCAGNSCAFTQYCAYHSWIGSGSTAILYANMPYAMTVPAACGSGQSPNGDDADATLNVLSHEHNETVTDAQGSAWYDRRGQEDGDKCAWNFGTALGSTSSGQYNQVLGNGKYYLQQEWSNQSSGCVLRGL